MNHDIEDLLTAELRDVAARVVVPPLPALPAERPRPSRWQPLVAAAAVVLLVLGIGTYVLSLGQESDKVLPAPQPSPTQLKDPEREEGPEPTAAPTDRVYSLAGQLYVGTKRVPGTTWSQAQGTPTGWVAYRDGTWWWGHDAEPQPLGPSATELSLPVAVSPNGVYHAEIVVKGGEGELTGGDTKFAGEGFGLPVPIAAMEDGVDTRVRAVTDTGQVIAQGARTSVLWQPLTGQDPIDLTQTAPDQVVLGVSSGGLLIVVDGSDGATDGATGAPYLAELGADGTMTDVGSLPRFGALLVGTEWALSARPGPLGGEGVTLDALTLTPVGGGQGRSISAPDGYEFAAPSPHSAWWDSGTEVLIQVYDEDDTTRLARCDAETSACVLVDLP